MLTNIYVIVATKPGSGDAFYWDANTKSYYTDKKSATFFHGGIEAKDWENLYINYEFAQQVALARQYNNLHISTYKLNYQGDLTPETLKELASKG